MHTLVTLGLLAALGVALLLGLGIWQLERRVWKLDLIEQVDARVHADPVPAPGASAWPTITTDADQYLRVTARGHFLNDKETLVQAVTDLGSGFWVLTPLVTDQGSTVLINRGFVPPDQRAPSSRVAGEIAGEAVVTGLLRITEPGGGFLRSNDPEHDRWYSRDVAAIASARQLDHVAPYFIDADGTPNPGGSPVGGLTVISFPNNHLVYALTWFVLAAMLAGGAVYVGYDEWRFRKSYRQ
ncbi:MAG TPA: SURF1 family protein [Devosiaceae bacterium]|nr:SURF1 family protein [Devosiaceae bacterium]